MRGREARQKLKGHTCADCDKFLNAVAPLDKEGDSNLRKALINQCSRHRNQDGIEEETPDGFWSISFDDEKDACS